MEQPQRPQVSPLEDGRHGKPLVFISHDTRDADVAELFSKLLSSVSAGVLKSFRSSDKRGNQGIEYGVEWYPEIMKKLESASDVVCLLTPNSVNRPWILYEAGVAKGKLDTPVHGVALGIPLQAASVGPFAQFQNCDDAEDSLTQLVMQLVGRIPNAEPDRDVVKTQVELFKQKILSLLAGNSPHEQSRDNVDEVSTAKIFEEIKVMFQDLPGRIESRMDKRGDVRMESGHSAQARKRRRFNPKHIREMMHIADVEYRPSAALLIIASLVKDDLPWVYDIAVDVHRSIESNSPDSSEHLKRFMHLMEAVTHHPIFREYFGPNDERRYELEEAMGYAYHITERCIAPMRARQTRMAMKDPSESELVSGGETGAS